MHMFQNSRRKITKNLEAAWSLIRFIGHTLVWTSTISSDAVDSTL